MATAMGAVFRELLRRELGERFRGSVLGAGWLLLLPLLQLAVLAFVFGQLLPARVHDGAWPYAAFLALGLWSWNLFASAVGRATTALTDNAALIGKVAVPHRLYVDARVAAALLLELGGLLLVLLALLAFGVPLSAGGLHWTLVGLALLAVHAWAWSRLLAVLQVFLRDVAAAIGQWLTLAFFLSPVLYERSLLPEPVSRALGFNPLAAPIEAVRAGLRGESGDPIALAWSAAAAMLVGLAAWGLYRRARPHLEDYL